MSTLPTDRAASQSRWETHKESLRQLYLVEKKTLKEVDEFMEGSYNFKATKSQYEHAFRQWGFEKNLKRSDWTAIDHHTSKRKRNGKDSEVFHDDILVPSKKFRKEILRNRRTVSSRMDGAQSPKLPNCITIRTPATSPKIIAGALPGLAIEGVTIFEATGHFPNPINPISESVDRDLFVESYDLGDHIRNDSQTIVRTIPSIFNQYSPHPCSPPRYFDDLLLNHGLDLGLRENKLANFENFDDFGTYNIMDQEWSISPIEASDIFRNAFDATPVTRQDHFNVSNWGGKHSRALHNIPWFRFQQIITTGSSNSSYSAIPALQSLTSGLELTLPSHSPIPYNLAMEERQSLLSRLFSSTTTLNGLKTHTNFTSLLQDLVPERFDGEMSNKIQHFLDPLNKNSLYQLAEFYLYFLSNNKFTKAQADSSLKRITEQKPLGLLKALFQIKTPTTQVFSDKILEFSVRRRTTIDLRFLIDCGIDKSCLSGVKGGRYLQSALASFSSDIAEFLLDYEVDVNPPLGIYPYDEPPLQMAVERGYLEVVRRLINAGANLNRKSIHGMTALANGLEVNGIPVDCIRLLLEAGADVDNDYIDDIPLLDWVYLNTRELYSITLSRSRVAKRSLTVSRILCAASKGCQALSQYLNRMQPVGDWQRKNKLEIALCLAATIDQPIQVVRILLEFGVHPNVVTTSSPYLPPLYHAAENNDIDLAEVLLDKDASITPVVLKAAASLEKNFDILNFLIEKLIEKGSDIKTLMTNALRSANFEENLGVVKLLLRAGADINYPALPKSGRTLLQKAVWEGNLKAIKYMIDQGADINAPPSHSGGLTALQVAAFQGHMEIVKFLLDSGAEINSAPSRSGGKTVLEASADCYQSSGRAELFKLFLGRGAYINRPKRQRHYRNWNSALTILIKNSSSDGIIHSALIAGADVNEPGNGEWARTPLQAAAEVGDIRIVQLLLDKGANVNAPPSTCYGRTALQAACLIESPKIELVKLLLDKGADVDIPAGFKGGLTALQCAAIQGHIKIVLMLLDAHAEVNAEPAAIKGRTALDGAAEHGRLDMVQLLLNLGAESEEPGVTGYDKAISLAEENYHLAIVDLLKNHSKKD